MTSLLSTGKKKAKASRVFGGGIFEVVSEETSLWYSPSPRSSKAASESESNPNENPEPIVLFHETTVVNSKDEPKMKERSIDKENEANNSRNVSFQSLRDAELSRLRAAKLPSQRNSLAEKTEAAIQNATSSVRQTLKTPASKFQTLNACRKAKKEVIKGRTQQAKSVRFQWDEQKAGAKVFYKRLEENRRKLLAAQRQLASTHFQHKARSQEAKKLEYIAKLDKESHFNSEVFREQQRKLKEERDTKRKQSMEARAKIRMDNKAGEEKLENIKRKEEEAIFEVRSDLHRARREAHATQAQERRKSFQFRAGDAKRIRSMRSKWQNEHQIQEHESYELKRAAAKDVYDYKQQMSKERRESLQNRGRDARRQREKEQDNILASMKAEHESYELKWAGEKDAEAYEEKMRDERRKSLAARNKESFRHAQVMQELRALNLEKEAESFMLKFAAENDAKAYLQKLAQARRESLQSRGKEKQRQRAYEAERHHEAVSNATKDGILQSECQKDVENYKKEMEAKARKSLQFRGKEARMRRLADENEARKQEMKDHKSFELDSLARMDVNEYLKDCKRQRRKSLACRAKEKRRHAEWRRRQQEKEIEQRQESGHLQALDYQYMALAQQQERARIAMDALRSAGCNIRGNPFGDLLGNL